MRPKAVFALLAVLIALGVGTACGGEDQTVPAPPTEQGEEQEQGSGENEQEDEGGAGGDEGGEDGG